MPPRSVAQLDHLSQSAVGLYDDCPQLWAHVYLGGHRGPATPPLLIGSAFDAAVEDYLRHPTCSLRDLWSTHWYTTVAEAGAIDWQGQPFEAVEATGRALAEHPHTVDILDALRLKRDESGPWLQKRLDLWIPGVPVPVWCILDFVEEDGMPGDFKTSARPWKPEKPHEELQPKLYIAALVQAGYDVPRTSNGKYLFHYLIWDKSTPGRVQDLVVEYSAADVYDGVLDVLAAWQAMTRGEFGPKRWGSWRCSPRFCPLYGPCMAAEGKELA